MTKKKRLPAGQIRELIRAGKSFIVASKSERKDALYIAKILGVDFTSREHQKGYIVYPTPTQIQ